MKKGIILILSAIALIISFVSAELFGIYHFGSLPTLLTSIYLVSIFAIFEHLFISIGYIVRKIIKKEKIEIKNILGLILLLFALLLILSFLIVIELDWLNWYAYSSPFYLNVIYRSIEFLVPSIALTVFGILLIKNKK